MALEEFVQTYRKKLGSYDTKPWERAMEASVAKKKSFSDIPKRPTKLKLELIDVDLVRGSTFPKEKSQLPWTFFSRDSFIRAVLLPFRSHWWTEQTSRHLFHLLVLLYTLQLFSLITFVHSLYSGQDPWTSACESLTPVILMFIVSEILTQAERHDKNLAAQLDSISDDTSIDLDDLASLSDRSCGSCSPCPMATPEKLAHRKVFRKTKRRVSRCFDDHNRNIVVDEVIHWQSKSTDVMFVEEEEELVGKESGGFGNVAISESLSLTRRKSVVPGDETTDSGLVITTEGEGRKRRTRTLSEVSERPPGNEDAEESDVSDVELKRVSKTQPLDESTSDKEATDEEIISQKRASLPADFLSRCATSCVSDDDDDLPAPQPLFSAYNQLIGCTLWEGQRSCHKDDLTVYEITNSIVKQVENTPVVSTSRVILMIIPVVFSLLPACHALFLVVYPLMGQKTGGSQEVLWSRMRLNLSWEEWAVVAMKVNGIVQRFFWGFWFFLLLAVAHETYQQRYLIAKYFGYLTSSRRAKRSNLPHFRLSKVRNVKGWLCVRSCLKKYGPRKSVDVVVSFSCVSCLICVIFTCFMVVNAEDQFTTSIYVWEAMLWLLAVGFYLLRFMTLGSKTNQKFRNPSVLTTEQLNLYLRMEQKPNKKDQLMLVNNVLKLAGDLIKEIEHPCKISGFPANPFLYNISRLLILSAFSTLISEICGFKLKLYKLKM